jgi:hypothetical protein
MAGPDVTPHVNTLRQAWETIVEYRQMVHRDTGIFRSHLVDLDIWGVLQELHEENKLIGSPDDVMRVLVATGLEPALPAAMYDPAQEIYDSIINLLDKMGVLR